MKLLIASLIIIIILLIILYIYFENRNFLKIKLYEEKDYGGRSHTIRILDMPISLVIYFDGSVKIGYVSKGTRTIDVPPAILSNPKSFAIEGDFYKNLKRLDIKLKDNYDNIFIRTGGDVGHYHRKIGKIGYMRFYFV